MNLQDIPRHCAEEAEAEMEAGNVVIGEFGREIVRRSVEKSFERVAAWLDEWHRECRDPQACTCQLIADRLKAVGERGAP